MKNNFITDCLNDISILSEVDDYIDYWYLCHNTTSLIEYLGMTEDEYYLFIKDEGNLIKIINERKRKIRKDKLKMISDVAL